MDAGRTKAPDWFGSWIAPLVARSRMDGIPRPPSNAVVRAGGPARHRVLVIGGGPAVGWGVLAHDVALSGHLVRLLAKLLGTGIEIDVRADPNMTAKSLLAALDAVHSLGDYDALVVTVGVNDAIAGTDPAAWSERLDAAIRIAEDRGLRRSAVILVKIQPIGSIPAYVGRIALRADPNRMALNAASARLLHAPDRGRTLELSVPEPTPERFRDSGVYARWARDLVPMLAEILRTPDELESQESALGAPSDHGR